MNTNHPYLFYGGIFLLLAPTWLFLLDLAGIPFRSADPLNVALSLAGVGGVFLMLSQRGSWPPILIALAGSAIAIVAQFYLVAAIVASSV